MGASLSPTNIQLAEFDYYLQDNLGNEWQMRIDAEVSLGSPMERDEAGIPYPGCQPEATLINTYWCKGDGTFLNAVSPLSLPPSMLDAIEEKAISLANEQANEQQIFS